MLRAARPATSGRVRAASGPGIPRPATSGHARPQFITFWVIFATLVGQGLTLPLVIRWLGVSKLAEAEERAAEDGGPVGP